MEKWRLLRTGHSSAAMNMGIDHAVLEARAEGRVAPTLRVYEWRPSAISIGYFQGMQEEVDLLSCEKHGVDVVRRITGGGAVYHDEKGEVTYSIIFKEGDVKLPARVSDAYPKLCEGIVLGLQKLGLEAEFKPVNDIISGGKKISGNAQTRRMGCVLQHGTLLYDVDAEMMFTLLLVPDEKIRDKMIAAVKERVTSIRHETGGKKSIEDVEDALVWGFGQALGVEFEMGRLTPEEKKRAEEIAREKYGNKEWNFRR
ncbi:MAG: biotin/lipoate A/B protein ligase family protein [Candidatus Thermoplasmatota archaeon]|nr:biotin/lipoate A/B protein ligase family protein [Candidatus Thermoplasmatota archaeon]